MTAYAERIAGLLNLRPHQVAATIELLDSGNTIPFIARYRKEMTSMMDEEQLRQTEDLLRKLRALDERKETVLASIQEQGKLTDDLRQQIESAETQTELEDLYAPYKPKRKTRATVARERDLQPLADQILQQVITKQNLEVIVQPFLCDDVPTLEDALSGARDIVAETISDQTLVRQSTREKAMKWGTLRSEKIEDAEDVKRVYEMYYALESKIEKLRPHQVLAINRGETEKVLRVTIDVPEQDWRGVIGAYYRADRRSIFFEQLHLAISDSAERLLLPSIERDIRRSLTETAERHAISVFAANLRALLSQPPLAGLTVLGIDPGFRTGSKIAVIDPTGKVLTTGTIYPHEPQKRWREALDELKILIFKHKVNLLVLGNGTASRETEKLAVELIKEVGSDLHYLITNEAGASVYSASPLARAEMPDLDVSLRGAVSIARRVQDPLAELVKIDPKSIGVGLYQHDVDQNELTHALSGVVESVVNQVGVDVNTASPALLTYVSGIGPKLSEKIVAYRNENGPYVNRSQLKKVSGLGPKAFEQAAGFMRIRGGNNLLDASAIHPESYPVAELVLKKANCKLTDSIDQRKPLLENFRRQQPIDKMARELEVGVPTLNDIFEQLIRPGRDPRQDLPLPILRSDILSVDDLSVGMRMKGTVRNVVDFGAFVDIGVKQDGLLHRTQMAPGTVLIVGNIIDVEIIRIEKDRGRIALKLVD